MREIAFRNPAIQILLVVVIDDALNVFFRLLLASCKSSPSLVVVLVDGLPNDDDLDYVVATIFIDKTDAWREERNNDNAFVA